MNILIVGASGREHALAWKLAQSKKLNKLFILPGNPGTASLGTNVPGDPMNLDQVVQAAQAWRIDLAVIGSEAPLAAGLADRLRAVGIRVFGPSQAAAEIEASKAFAKGFMHRHHIPTAAFIETNQMDKAIAAVHWFSQQTGALPVIKASGLAAGKGVLLPDTLEEAEVALRGMLETGQFGLAGERVVIEERLAGREVSLLAFTDGITVVPMPPAQDHKRLLDHNLGPNTGGMGAFAPAPDLAGQVLAEVLQPAVDGMLAEGRRYMGVLYAGLMLTATGPKVLEFNSRFGDPETQAILPLLETDLLEILVACSEERLGPLANAIEWSRGASVCVILASAGYPEKVPVGLPITGLDDLPPQVIAFQGGTRLEGQQLVTDGGRVVGLTGVAPTLLEARSLAYAGVTSVHFAGMQYRKDIAAPLEDAASNRM